VPHDFAMRLRPNYDFRELLKKLSNLLKDYLAMRFAELGSEGFSSENIFKIDSIFLSIVFLLLL